MASYAQSFMDALPRTGGRSIVQDVRRSVYLLLPMGRVAQLLGYSNLSSFTRWFTTQFRHAPSRQRG